LGGISERLPIDGAVAQELSLVVQLLDNIRGSFLLRAGSLYGSLAITVPLAHVAHGSLEAWPILLLLRCQAKVGFNTGGTRSEIIGDLVRGKYSAVRTDAGDGRTASLRNSEDSLKAALNAADDTANGTADCAPNRTGSTIALSGAFFCAPDNALGLRHQRL
jgi:hypothetical protein